MDTATYEFDRDTAVESIGEGRYRGLVSSGYSIGPYPNGGYLLAIAVRAVGRELVLPDPLAVSAHYVTPSINGEAFDVDVEVIRAGRGHATAQARCTQAGTERMRVLATFGDLSRAEGPTIDLGSPPELPPIEDCLGGPRRDGGPQSQPMPNGLVAAIRDRWDARLDPRTVPWLIGEGPNGRGEIAGYGRFPDGREPDTAAMMLIADAFPPAVFNMARAAWVPTLEFTVLVRARPAPGWLRCRFTTSHLRQGYMEEDGEIWDSAGVLVCQSRQLARVNTPRSS
jgi:acyl-CoA thioesterase